MTTKLKKILSIITIFVVILIALYSIPFVRNNINYWTYVHTFSCRQMTDGNAQWCTDRLNNYKKELGI